MSIDFNHYTVEELFDSYGYLVEDTLTDIQGSDETLMSFIEEIARQEGQFESEEELSKEFDNVCAIAVLEQYGRDDQVAMNEEFNNWTDCLREDGRIHEIQYDQYCYVGRYSR